MNGASGMQPTHAHPARRIHPLGRMLFAAGLLVSLLMIHGNFPLLLGVLAGCVMLLGWLCASLQPVLRAARLLLWLVLPVVLLHLMFTPGQLLWPGSAFGFTREGMHQGLWLGLRLCAMFYAAMLLSRALSREEWTYYCLRLPYFGPRLLPYVSLSPSMRELASRSLSETKMHLNLTSGWRDAPRLLHALGDVIGRVWHGSAVQAQQVWEHWDELPAVRRPSGNLLAGAMLVLIGALMPLGIWMAG